MVWKYFLCYCTIPNCKKTLKKTFNLSLFLRNLNKNLAQILRIKKGSKTKCLETLSEILKTKKP